MAEIRNASVRTTRPKKGNQIVRACACLYMKPRQMNVTLLLIKETRSGPGTVDVATRGIYVRACIYMRE